uniref:Uncharacterized protein n=1 Tax=Zooxanthella nutricula TaxID=1333877 RepID=A0A7S2NLB0_9DINO|mmetsp:Transcript_30834/g.93293  ORF Transcript_30834/g.93293 Transcript_30834/m.93293 type:complete len:513 (+) Transcript_30834:307-1845(+)
MCTPPSTDACIRSRGRSPAQGSGQTAGEARPAEDMDTWNSHNCGEAPSAASPKPRPLPALSAGSQRHSKGTQAPTNCRGCVSEPPPPPPPPRPPEPVEPAPDEGVYCGRAWLRAQACLFVVWVLLASALLVLHILRFRGETRTQMHLLVADSAMRALEVNASGLLSPALSCVRTVALASRSGLFLGVEDPVAAFRTVITPELSLAPAVRQVQVLGLQAGRLVRALPGRLHDLQAAASSRRSLVHDLPTSACYSPTDPMACFGLNTSGATLMSAPTESADLVWLGPTYLRTGAQGEERHPATWDLAHHLVAFVNMTEGVDGASVPHLFLDVAVELAGVAAAARRAAPLNGDVVVATPQGWVLATSQPAGEPRYVLGTDGRPARRYDGFWDLDVGWAPSVTPAMLASPQRRELWLGSGDLVVLRPLELGMRGKGQQAAAAMSLRIAVFVPRDTAVRPLLVYLQWAGVGVLASPSLAVVWYLCSLAWARFRLPRWARSLLDEVKKSMASPDEPGG